jgi:hypothetical protein
VNKIERESAHAQIDVLTDADYLDLARFAIGAFDKDVVAIGKRLEKAVNSVQRQLWRLQDEADQKGADAKLPGARHLGF